MFQLAFLGTAAAVPSPDRGLSALMVAAGPRRFLVDCGEGTQRQLMRAGLGFRGLDYVLLTHAHLDHVLGLAGLISTLALFQTGIALDILGATGTIAFVRRYLAAVVGPEGRAGYRLREIGPGQILDLPGMQVDAFRVIHRETDSLGYVFEESAHRPLDPQRLAALGVPAGPERAALARGEAVVLADGRRIVPEMVASAVERGTRLAVVGDTGETASLVASVVEADTLVVEATFLERDRPLALARGHLTAAMAAGLARDAGVGALLLTHISGRYQPAEILAEAAAIFPTARLVADFDRAEVRRRVAAASV